MSTCTLIIGNRNYSSWSLRGWLAASQSGIDFETEFVRLSEPGSQAVLLRHSPAGRVPVLRHGERVVWDSLAIIEYLAERCPNAGLWPADADARAMALAVGILLVDKFYQQSSTDEDELIATAGRHPIAVLPFVNMSDDSDHFADGLSEELLNLLAMNPELKVAGRTSAFAFKGRNEDLREIGDALGVEYVLEGSVRRSGERLRITAQLIKVGDGFHVWSDTYDRQMADIFDIQDDVAGAITDALRLRLSHEQLGATRERANTLGDIAQILGDKGQVGEALKLHQERLGIYEQLEDAAGRANALWSIANIEIQHQSFQAAFDHLVESYQIFVQLERLDGICVVGLDLGCLLADAGQTEQAVPILTRSCEGFKQRGQLQMAQQVQQLIDQIQSPPSSEDTES
jgi:TolB-like protein